MKDDVLKVRVSKEKKQAWKVWAETHLPSMTLTELVTNAVDDLTTGDMREREQREGALRAGDCLRYVLPHEVNTPEYEAQSLARIASEVERMESRRADALAALSAQQ